jgi:hypothetical protein
VFKMKKRDGKGLDLDGRSRDKEELNQRMYA